MPRLIDWYPIYMWAKTVKKPFTAYEIETALELSRSTAITWLRSEAFTEEKVGKNKHLFTLQSASFDDFMRDIYDRKAAKRIRQVKTFPTVAGPIALSVPVMPTELQDLYSTIYKNGKPFIDKFLDNLDFLSTLLPEKVNEMPDDVLPDVLNTYKQAWMVMQVCCDTIESILADPRINDPATCRIALVKRR